MSYWLDAEQRMQRSGLDSNGVLLLISGTAYFVYLGYSLVPITPQFVETQLTVVGAGAQTAEVGLFSTPLPPNKAAQSLTPLVATGTVDSLTAGVVVKRNTVAFATQIAAGVHVWAGIRTAMAVTQPTLGALAGDFAQGWVLSLPGSGVLTGAGPFAGALIALGALNTTPICPDLRATLD
jgi:hypothetical protein